MARPDFFGRASECTAKAASSHINTSGDILLRQSCETISEQGENGEGRKGTMVHGPSDIAMTTARSKSNQGAAKVNEATEKEGEKRREEGRKEKKEGRKEREKGRDEGGGGGGVRRRGKKRRTYNRRVL